MENTICNLHFYWEIFTRSFSYAERSSLTRVNDTERSSHRSPVSLTFGVVTCQWQWQLMSFQFLVYQHCRRQQCTECSLWKSVVTRHSSIFLVHSFTFSPPTWSKNVLNQVKKLIDISWLTSKILNFCHVPYYYNSFICTMWIPVAAICLSPFYVG